MSKYEPNKHLLREVLLFAFNSAKSAAVLHRIIVGTSCEAFIRGRTRMVSMIKKWQFGYGSPEPVKNFEKCGIGGFIKRRFLSNRNRTCRFIEGDSVNHFKSFKVFGNDLKDRTFCVV